MLERLLQILREQGTHTIGGVASELGVSRSLVEMMIEDLIRMGYLAPMATSCSGQCSGCPVADCRIAGDSGRVWALTEKALE